MPFVKQLNIVEKASETLDNEEIYENSGCSHQGDTRVSGHRHTALTAYDKWQKEAQSDGHWQVLETDESNPNLKDLLEYKWRLNEYIIRLFATESCQNDWPKTSQRSLQSPFQPFAIGPHSWS